MAPPPWQPLAAPLNLSPAARLLAHEGGGASLLAPDESALWVVGGARLGLPAGLVRAPWRAAQGDDRVWFLGHEGGVSTVSLATGESAPWTRAQGDGPDAALTGFTYDPSTGAPLRLGGDGRNDLWLAGRSWRELDVHPRPPHGAVNACVGEGGAWLACGDELWWTAHERFECRGFTPGDEPAALLEDGPRGALWASVHGALCAWAAGGWARVVEAPQGGPITALAMDEERVNLLALNAQGLWRAPLDSVALPAHAELPSRGLVVPVLRHARPPPGSTREAAWLRCEGDAVGASVRSGDALYLPADPRWLPLARHRGLRVEQGRAVLVNEGDDGPRVQRGDEVRALAYEGFAQLDPALRELVDTPLGAGPRAGATYVAGHAPEGARAPRCGECRRTMGFVLWWVRDEGEQGVWVCPAECEAATRFSQRNAP